MSIPAWRIALTGAAIVVLAMAGIGLASAAGAPTRTPDGAPAAAPAGRPASAPALDALGPRAIGLRALRHVVHGVVTFQDRNGDLVTVQLDRGTVTAVDANSMTLSEAGGTSVTVALDADTKVRVGRQRGSLDDIDVGDDLFVQSRVTAGSALAKHVRILPAA